MTAAWRSIAYPTLGAMLGAVVFACHQRAEREPAELSYLSVPIRGQALAVSPAGGLRGLVDKDDLRKILRLAEPRWTIVKTNHLMHALRLWGPDAVFKLEPFEYGVTVPSSSVLSRKFVALPGWHGFGEADPVDVSCGLFHGVGFAEPVPPISWILSNELPTQDTRILLEALTDSAVAEKCGVLLFCFSRKWRDAPPELYYNSAGVSPCESLERTIRPSRRWPFFAAT